MKEKSEFAIRLKQLRKDKGITSYVVAQNIGIKDSTYRRYEIDTMPKIETLIGLSRYFGVSVDYLIGNN